MSNGLVKRGQKSLVASSSVSGAAGKTMVAAGTGALALSVLAAFIPFIGPVLLAVIFIGLGLALWE